MNSKPRFQIDLSSFRTRLARSDALPQLALLGLVSGILTGLVICAFRFAVEGPLGFALPGGDPENFEELHPALRLALPIVGAILIGMLFARFEPAQRRIGILNVLERLHYHQGYIELRSAMLQFIGGTLALLSGQSVGREGPAVHLGSATGSLLGQWLKLPNNSMRTLIGCGTAAAIAAAFNTPMAGVIFAMEVILMEYSIAGFMPIMIAAVSGAVVSQFFFSGEPVFASLSIPMHSQGELFFVAFAGVCIGLLAVGFNIIVRQISRRTTLPFQSRLIMAGLITGLCAWYVPEVLGLGYDTVNLAITGEIAFATLVIALVAKLLVSATAIGLGVPGGVIGPSVFIGAVAGGALGTIGDAIMPGEASSIGFYAMLGMGAMMGAVLQAPLAALVALMELTHHPAIIVPGMLAITIANLTAGELFHEKSLFQAMLEGQGIVLQSNPVVQMLRKAGITSIMNREFCRLPRSVSPETAERALRSHPRWTLIEEAGKKPMLMPAADLAAFLVAQSEKPQETPSVEASPGPVIDPPEETESIDLVAIPARRQEMREIHSRATLHEALDLLDESGVPALYVTRTDAPMISPILGIVTREDLENFYRYRK